MENTITETTNSQAASKQTIKSLFNWLGFILFLAILFFTVRFAIGIIIVEGDSMAPTIGSGDVFLSNNVLYDLDRHDVIVFQDEKGFDVIKRVIALPGETVEITSGTIYVNGTPMDVSSTKGIPKDMLSVTVQENAYFVIGDNRDPGESLDSRDPSIGSIPENRIKGEVVWSIKPFGKLP
ncbi:Signal peptidase I [Lentibacillus sp. JNUCC-1]|uniref:signal peptidase I n=1 Tax=Lentibacillus sp. JNUCC-1 TaxID=2654513 RepID=UPI0012E7D7A1|nr:signal peptidase I [Lentibacillus sp. JNUCC-1]MUV36359.1 Signal peptidase I [Lentibacillus sp. JNUCC-1]